MAFLLLMPLATLAVGQRWSNGTALAPQATTTAPAISGELAFNWRSFVASLAVSAACAGLAVVVGGLMAAAMELTDLPGRGFWATAMLVPFASPGAVWALAQLYCYGSSGLLDRWFGDDLRPWLAWVDTGHYASAVIVLGQIYAPLAMLLVGRGLAHLPQAGSEAAWLMLPPGVRWRWVVRAVRPEVAAAWLLAFALGLGNFAVPHVLQCRLFPIDVYLQLTNYLDLAGASRSALALLAAALFAVVALTVAERRRTYAPLRSETEWQRIHLGWRAWLVGGALSGYLAFTTVLPVAAMVAECGSPAKFLSAARDAAPETANTLRAAAWAAALALLAGVVVGRAAARKTHLALDCRLSLRERTPFRGANGDTIHRAAQNDVSAAHVAQPPSAVRPSPKATGRQPRAAVPHYLNLARVKYNAFPGAMHRCLELATLVPLGVPALVLAIGYSLFFNRASVLDLRALADTNVLIVLAWTARAWPFTARAMVAGERRIAPDWHAAAWLSGMGGVRRLRWITGPRLAHPALAAALIAYLLCVGDVEISQLLCTPGQGTLALRLFTFMHFGPVYVAASLAVLQLAVALLPLAAYFLFTNRCLQVV